MVVIKIQVTPKELSDITTVGVIWFSLTGTSYDEKQENKNKEANEEKN